MTEFRNEIDLVKKYEWRHELGNDKMILKNALSQIKQPEHYLTPYEEVRHE